MFPFNRIIVPHHRVGSVSHYIKYYMSSAQKPCWLIIIWVILSNMYVYIYIYIMYVLVYIYIYIIIYIIYIYILCMYWYIYI